MPDTEDQIFPGAPQEPEASEEQEDVRLALEALEAGQFTPWETVKRDLGLD